MQHVDPRPLGAQIRRPDHRSSFPATPRLPFGYNPQLAASPNFMRRLRFSLIVSFVCFAVACSPRDFLTRRLAADLIAGSETFKIPQQFWLRTGMISNKDYLSPEYLVLRRHRWMTGANVPCAPNIAPPRAGTSFSPLSGLRPFATFFPAI